MTTVGRRKSGPNCAWMIPTRHTGMPRMTNPVKSRRTPPSSLASRYPATTRGTYCQSSFRAMSGMRQSTKAIGIERTRLHAIIA